MKILWFGGGGDALLNFGLCEVFTLNHQGQPKKEPVIYQQREKNEWKICPTYVVKSQKQFYTKSSSHSKIGLI